MNVRPLHGRKLELPDAAMRGLQLLAQLEHLTPAELLERLIFDFLEMRSEDVEQMRAELAPPAPPRPPAKVIDLNARRLDRCAAQPPIRDASERSHVLRRRSMDVCARAALVRSVARQATADASAARAHAGTVTAFLHSFSLSSRTA